MKFKGLMLAGAAVIACGFFNTAEARSDRITMYEVQKFVEQYSDAVNSPNQDVMRSFLSMVNADAESSGSLVPDSVFRKRLPGFRRTEWSRSSQSLEHIMGYAASGQKKA